MISAIVITRNFRIISIYLVYYIFYILRKKAEICLSAGYLTAFREIVLHNMIHPSLAERLIERDMICFCVVRVSASVKFIDFTVEARSSLYQVQSCLCLCGPALLIPVDPSYHIDRQNHHEYQHHNRK